MNRYDLQVHTEVSPCSEAAPADIVDAALDAGLTGIAITDHDTLDGYAAVERVAPPELTVIPGVEVTTTRGHMLALGVQTVPPRSDPVDVVADIHSQGGLAVMSHPFDRLRDHYTDDLDRLAERVDGAETVNSRCLLPRFNRSARSYAETHGLASVGGSDAHFPMEVGRAYTECQGDLFAAIRTGRTQPAGRGGYVSGHVATKASAIASWLSGE